MLRKLALLFLLAGTALVIDARTTQAAPVSLRNPYRSFNLSGVNYGSMQWERQHRGRSSHATSHRGGWLFFRRR
jgi:hypothetical protein